MKFYVCSNLLVLWKILKHQGEKVEQSNCVFDAGLTLLRFKERVVNDPFGSLSNWKDDDGEIDPCSSWFGVECSDEKVVVL